MTLDEFKNNAKELALINGLSSDTPFSFHIFGQRCDEYQTPSRRVIVIKDQSVVIEKNPNDLWIYVDEMILYRMNAQGLVSSEDVTYEELFTEMICNR